MILQPLEVLEVHVTTTTRTITDLHIEIDGEKIKVFVSADGFLYGPPVRSIVGTLIAVGTGKIKAESIRDITKLQNSDKKQENALLVKDYV